MALKLTSEDIVWRQQLLEEQFKCDTALEIDSFKIGVHWLILCEHSDVFKAMYRSTCKESQPGHNIKLGFPIDAALLSTIVQYFYTHEITLSPQNCFECIGFAHMYQIQHLLKIAKKFFLDEIDLCDQPAHVLTDMNFYFREEQVSRMERRFILQLRHQHSMQWMELPVVLNLSVSGLVFLLCRFDLQCKDETNLFEVIVKWWKYEAEKREPHLQTIIDKALNTSELSADAVSRIVSSHVSEPDHLLFRFAETLPIESITTFLKEQQANVFTHHIESGAPAC